MVIHTLECPIFLLFSIILFRNDKQTFIFQKDILHGLLGIFGLNMLAHVQKKSVPLHPISKLHEPMYGLLIAAALLPVVLLFIYIFSFACFSISYFVHYAGCYPDIPPLGVMCSRVVIAVVVGVTGGVVHVRDDAATA